MSNYWVFALAVFYSMAVTLKKSLKEINVILFLKPKDLGGINKSADFLNDLNLIQLVF